MRKKAERRGLLTREKKEMEKEIVRAQRKEKKSTLAGLQQFRGLSSTPGTCMGKRVEPLAELNRKSETEVRSKKKQQTTALLFSRHKKKKKDASLELEGESSRPKIAHGPFLNGL